MSSVAVAYFYHFLVHVAIVRLITIKIFNQSAALHIMHASSPRPPFVLDFKHLMSALSRYDRKCFFCCGSAELTIYKPRERCKGKRNEKHSLVG